MKRIFPRSFLVAAAAVFVLSVLGNVAVPYASAQAVESPDAAMEQQTKEWLYYRGMWACLHGGFNDANLTRSDIEKGKWDPQNDKKGFGYFAPDMDEGDDGTVDCDDGSIFARAPGVFGFEDQIDLFCAIDAKLDKDMIDPVGGDCRTARDYKVERYKSGVVSKAFTEVLTDKMGGERPRFELRDNPNYNAMYYWIGKRSVEVFCGGGTSLEDGITDLNNDENAVRVKIVDASSGAVTESQTYNLDGRIDSDSIDDVYYKNDGDDEKAVEKKCSELATLTRDHAVHFSQYIISQLNLALANYFKDKFDPSDELRDSLCTKPPADGDEIDSPEERVYKACINNIDTRFDNIVDQCAASAELKAPMEYETRRDTLRKCITKNLPPEYRADIDKIPDPAIEERVNEEGGTDDTSCAVDGIGWIVCPLSNSIAKGVDNVYGLVEYFLKVEPLSFNNNSGLYSAWSAMRNFSNVAFVLAFLAIIYSQISGAGLTNYGIKKMLPKLVIAAILVNTSYIICALLVDVSNITGSSLQQLLVTIRDNAASTIPTDIPTWDIFITSVLSAGTLGGLAFVGLGAAGSFTALLWLAVPVLIAALFSVLMAVLVLAGRQALIIILITLAPLAFVAYLLPNTQKLFDKWKDIFVTLLIMYPILSVVFGGSQLAASIIMNNADNTVMVLLALVVQVIPLAITPLVIKFSGGFLNRVAGIVNNSQKGLLDKGKNYARERAALSTKKGLATRTPNLLNRMGQRRDFGARRRKALGEKYDAQANEGWLKSDTGRSHERDVSDAKLNEETARTRVNAFATANRSKEDAMASHVAKQELEMHNKIENAEFEELKVNDLSVDNSNLGALANEARNNLRETNVAGSRATAAGRVQQQEEATEIGKTTERHNPTTGQMETVQSALAQRMGGVDPNGTSRAVASATAALDKQWGENVSAEKTTMSSMGIDDIMTTMKDTSISAERRAAAAGMVMARGGDQHVQAALDYLGTADRSSDPDIANVQKQVAHDIGGRKPFALGETDVSTLANGTYGLDRDGNQTNGAFNDKLLGRIQAGKLGTNELLSMGTDELQRVTELAASGKLNDAEHSQISAAIEEIFTNKNITNPNEEKTALLQSVQARKPGKLTKLEPLVPPTKSTKPYGPMPRRPTP